MSIPAPAPADLVDALAAGFRELEAELRLEQAVHGLDVLDEVKLHTHLRWALVRAGYGVHAEQRYPRDRIRRRRSEGERCDLVVTLDGAALRHPDAAPSLFDPPNAVELQHAFWIEVKAAWQFIEGRPNARYTAEMGDLPRRDVRKLVRDVDIRRRALLLVLFAADETTAEHDLAQWERIALARGIDLGPPCRRNVELLDRIGHRVCVLSLYPIP